MKIDPVMDTLLDLDGSVLDQGNGYWIKIEASRTGVSDEVPHGIRYSLTLHEPYGKRMQLNDFFADADRILQKVRK